MFISISKSEEISSVIQLNISGGWEETNKERFLFKEMVWRDDENVTWNGVFVEVTFNPQP